MIGIDLKDKIYIAGHRGMVGSAIVRALHMKGYDVLVGKTSSELDIRCQHDVETFFTAEKPDVVVLAAAKVGGIYANSTYPAEFIYDNLMMECNIINSAYKNCVKKLLFLGSSCIYPKMCPQPIQEKYLLTGALEETNEAYAVAKIAGMELCKFYRRQYGCDFISAMPTNLYGTNDNFHPENSHVIPALIRKFHDAAHNGLKDVVLWGSGKPKREFLHVDDLAEACVFLLENYSDEMHVNVGTGEEVSIRELAEIVGNVTGFNGNIMHDISKPDGTPRKILDVSFINELGWKAKIPLYEGIIATYTWYLEHLEDFRES